MDIGSTIKFRDMCAMFEKLKKAPNVQRKEHILRLYYKSFCKHRESYRQQAGVAADQPECGGSSFYVVLRLLMPSADTARDNYGLQITALGRLYTRVLQLARDSDEALRLQHRSHSTVRDYADVVHGVLLPRCHNAPSDMSLRQIHDMLDIIANEDIKSKERELMRFTDCASAAEQKWLIRLLLKTMGLGIGEQRIFGLLHPHAKDIYQRCSDLARVCQLLADNKLSLDAVPASEGAAAAAGSNTSGAFNLNAVIEPFHQIRPMLCERFPGKMEQLMQQDVLYLETKMDGERFQLHYANGRFKYISRKGSDYTHSFGDSYERGSLTPRLRTLLPLGMESIILDGEMMIWDTQQQRYREKSENTDVKHLDPERSWKPCFVVYDLLYLNGQSLLDMSYVRRKHKVQELLTEQQGVLQVMKGRKLGSLEEFNRLFQEVLDSNAEGIVLKKQNSTYMPGVRVGGGWYKDKADYIKGLTTEFDLLIIGGFYNRKRTFINTFLLGVLKPSGAAGRDEVFSVGRVDNNTRERVVLNNDLKPHWHDAAREPPPLWYHYKAGNVEGTPDVWIEPCHSTILQIRAADLAPCSSYYLSKALHFPRTDLVRGDKVWNECMTLQEYTQMCQGRGGVKKINKRQLRLDDFTTERKRQKMSAAERSKLGLAAYDKRFDAEQMECSSQLLDGFTVCILSGALQRHHSKQQLQELAARNGGSIVANPLLYDPKCICIAGDITLYVQRMIAQEPRTNDIVRLDWLLRVCEKQQIYLRPKDMIAATESLQAQFAKSYDKLGDSFTDPVCSVEELQELLADISDSELEAVDVDECSLAAVEQQLLGAATPNFFRSDYACFYNANGGANCELAKLRFMQRGGQWLSDLDSASSEQRRRLTHIVVGKIAGDAAAAVKEFEAWRGTNFPAAVRTLSMNWITESHRAGRKLDVAEYLWPAAPLQ